MIKIKQVIEHCEKNNASFTLIETNETGRERFCAIWGRPENFDLTPGAGFLVGAITMDKALRLVKASIKGAAQVQGKIILTSEAVARKRYEAMVENADFVTFKTIKK